MVFTPQQQQALLQLLEQSATSKIVNPQDLQILRNDMRRTINANLAVMKNLLAEANHAVRSDIVDTINQCLQQKSNLFDVDDIKAARSNLGLGTLATLNQLPPEQLPIASTTRAGIVQLTSVTDSESETVAASAKAIKKITEQNVKLTSSLEQVMTHQNPVMVLYPGGSASNPAVIAINQRVVLDNPFPGHMVHCQIEIQISGLWGDPGFVWSDWGSHGIRVSSLIGHNLDVIVVQAGNYSVMGSSIGTGNPFAINIETFKAPFRVKIWKV